MKVVLMGTNSWVIKAFEKVSENHEVLAVFTKAPKPAGRKMELQKSPVHIWADAKGFAVYNKIADYNFKPDFLIVASYGVILKDDILNSAPNVNIHPSLLPKYRGPSPVLTALFNGDEKTGICLMELANEVDAGDVYMCRDLDISVDDNMDTLNEKISTMSADMLNEFLSDPKSYPKQKQIGEISHTKKFTKQDMIIDWKKSPIDIHNQIRSVGGKTKINGIDVSIIKTKIKDDGGLDILRIKPAGKNEMNWLDFVNGQRGVINIGE